MEEKNSVLEILKKNILPAFGCTDPITPALGGAIAYNELKGNILDIQVIVSNDIYKGAYSVIIPGTGKAGIDFAVLLGAIGGNHKKGLMVLEDCTKEHIHITEELIQKTHISVVPDDTKGEVYTEINMKTNNGDAKVIFDGRHETIAYLEVNGEKVYNDVNRKSNLSDKNNYFENLTLDTVIEGIEGLNIHDLAFLEAALSMNAEAGIEGLDKEYGLSIGKKINKVFEKEDNQPYFTIKAFASSAGDVRMGGGRLPIMSVFGSGNQGAVIFNCLNKVQQVYNIEKLTCLRGVALSCILAGWINELLEEGTPFCDCAIVAATAASAGVVYMLDGSKQKIEGAIQSTISCLAGIFCDGAKPNCAQKISLGVGSAIENALIAVHTDMKIIPDGILGSNFVETFKNLTTIGNKIKGPVEQQMVEILKCKELRC